GESLVREPAGLLLLGQVSVDTGGRGFRGDKCWRQADVYGRGQFVATEELGLGGAHVRHGRIRFAVIVIGIPEQETDSALVFGDLDLYLDVLRRVCSGAPAEGLKPGANYHATALGNQPETIHGLADEVLRRISGVRVAIHPEEVRGVDHGRKHIAKFCHADYVLPGVSEVYRTLPRHDSEDIQRQENP